jgi:hypothetical protein
VRTAVDLRRVRGRALSAVVLFGGLLGAPCALALIALIMGELDIPELAVAAVGLACLSLFASVGWAWAAILMSARKLDRADFAFWQGGDDDIVSACEWVLAWTFRSDLRTRALYLLGQVAERDADFASAAQLFQRSAMSVPMFAAKPYATRARALMFGHMTFDAAASGDVPAARAHLAIARRELAAMATARAGVFDDAHMGPVSVNASLTQLEARRDPHTLVALAEVVLLYREGRPAETLQALQAWSAALSYGVSDSERALLGHIHAASTSGLSPLAPMRSPARPALPDAPNAAWLARVLGA